MGCLSRPPMACYFCIDLAYRGGCWQPKRSPCPRLLTPPLPFPFAAPLRPSRCLGIRQCLARWVMTPAEEFFLRVHKFVVICHSHRTKFLAGVKSRARQHGFVYRAFDVCVKSVCFVEACLAPLFSQYNNHINVALFRPCQVFSFLWCSFCLWFCFSLSWFPRATIKYQYIFADLWWFSFHADKIVCFFYAFLYPWWEKCEGFKSFWLHMSLL